MPEDKQVRKKFEEALNSFIEQVKQDDYITAALLFGSLVNGKVWEKSDIDLVLITRDEQTPYKDFWIFEEDINVQVSVFTRNRFIRYQQRMLQGTGTHHVLTTSKILFSKDESINEFVESMRKIGRRDFELRMLYVVSMVIGDLEKAEKFLYVMDDVAQSYLFITRLLDHFAQIVVMLNNEIPGREAVEQALRYEPELFKEIFVDVVLEKADEEKLQRIIAVIREYLVKKTPEIFRLVIAYFKEEGTFRSLTDIARFMNDRLASNWWYIAVLGICNWLVEQGYLQRVPCPVRLTNRSRMEVNEIGYFYIGDDGL